MPRPTRTLALDIFIGTTQPNPSWIGQLQIYANCPSGGINNRWFAQVELTPLARGLWVPVTFAIPDAVLRVLQQKHTDFTWRLALNTNAGSGPYYFDNLRYQ